MPFEPIATQEEFDERVKARLRRECELRGKVSRETGVPAELIVGDDEESMTAFARSVGRSLDEATACAEIRAFVYFRSLAGIAR